MTDEQPEQIKVKRTYNKFDDEAKRGHPSKFPKAILKKVAIMRYRNKLAELPSIPCPNCGELIRKETKNQHMRSKKCISKGIKVENI